MSAVLVVLVACAIPLLRLRDVSYPYWIWARDRWLMAVGWLAALSLCMHGEALFGLFAMTLLLRWRGPEDLPHLLTWAGIFATWLWARSLPVDWRISVTLVWAVIGAATSLWVLLIVWAYRWERLPIWLITSCIDQGTIFGQRTIAAAYWALLLPAAAFFPSPWKWAVGGLLVGGLLANFSWLALLAATAGMIVLVPVSALGLSVLITLMAAEVVYTEWYERRTGRYHHGWLNRLTTRGASRDSIRTRWLLWTSLWRIWRQWPVWLLGRGFMGARRDQVGAMAAYRDRPIVLGPVHNDLIELVYDHGLVGLAVAIGLAIRLWPSMAWGDPWTAMAVSGFVLLNGTLFTHLPPVALPWWLVLAWMAP